MSESRGEGTVPPKDWSEAVSEAATHAEERARVEAEAEAPRSGRWRGPVLAATMLVLGAVIVWDVRVLTGSPEIPPPEVEERDLRRFVVGVAELVEDFRAENGRLPSRAELGDLLDPEVSYEVQGETYVVGMTGEGEGVSVTYTSTVPLSEWLGRGGDETRNRP